MNKEKIAQWLFKNDLHPTSKIDWANKWTALSQQTKQFWLEKADGLIQELGYRKPSPELRAILLGLVLTPLPDIPAREEIANNLVDKAIAFIAPKDKPPLLSDEEIEQAIEPYILSSYRNPSGDFMSSAEVAKRVTLQRKMVAKAQWETDIKWYERE